MIDDVTTDGMNPAWPAPLALLLGPEAGPLLQAVLDGYGGRLLSARVVTAGLQPRGAVVVQYDAEVERADGLRTREILAATTGSRIPAGAAVLAGDVDGVRVEVGVWRWPQDPALPALATAADPARLTDALRGLGLADADGVRVRAYRPGRRAVLAIDGGGRTRYVKVVRPPGVDALVRRHALLAPLLPVPPVLGATADGLVVLPEQPGTPLRALLADDVPPPRPDALEALLDRLPPELLDLPGRRRPGPLGRVAHFTEVLRRTVGGSVLLDDVAEALSAADPGTHPDVPVHGDFYEAQMLADAGRVTGLLDVDTAGAGHRVDEWATALAHLSVLTTHPAARSYGAALLAHVEHRFPRAELRPRIAAAVLGLATGPFRVQQPGWAEHTRRRLELAAHWMRTLSG